MFQMGMWQNFEVLNHILIRQAVSPIRKAVVAYRHNPIAVITLSPTLGVRYNYYKQLVAIKRDWMRVPNLKLLAKGGVEST